MSQVGLAYLHLRCIVQLLVFPALNTVAFTHKPSCICTLPSIPGLPTVAPCHPQPDLLVHMPYHPPQSSCTHTCHAIHPWPSCACARPSCISLNSCVTWLTLPSPPPWHPHCCSFDPCVLSFGVMKTTGTT